MFFVIPHSVPAFTTHTKLVSRPLQIREPVLAQGPDGTQVLIGSFGSGSIVAAQMNVHSPLQLTVHQSVPYTTATGDPMAVPLKLLFTRFPPFIEAIVQRIQNFFSTYNYVGNENYPISPPANDPVLTTTAVSTSTATTATTPVPASTTTTETPTATTLQPLATNAGSQTENNPNGEQNSSVPEGTYRHKHDPPASNPLKYPYPKTRFQRFTSKEFPSPGVRYNATYT
jgi:hypothetical protein